MVVDERSRHELYRKLEEVLGSDAATTLIEHLPPVGWADVATKRDLIVLEERLELRFARIDGRFDLVDERFIGVAADMRATFEHELRAQSAVFHDSLRSQTLTMVFALVSVVLTMSGLAFALVRFT